jgi:hypothetical protein
MLLLLFTATLPPSPLPSPIPPTPRESGGSLLPPLPSGPVTLTSLWPLMPRRLQHLARPPPRGRTHRAPVPGRAHLGVYLCDDAARLAEGEGEGLPEGGALPPSGVVRVVRVCGHLPCAYPSPCALAPLACSRTHTDSVLASACTRMRLTIADTLVPPQVHDHGSSPCVHTPSLTHSLTHSRTHPLTHSITHLSTHALRFTTACQLVGRCSSPCLQSGVRRSCSCCWRSTGCGAACSRQSPCTSAGAWRAGPTCTTGCS